MNPFDDPILAVVLRLALIVRWSLRGGMLTLLSGPSCGADDQVSTTVAARHNNLNTG